MIYPVLGRSADNWPMESICLFFMALKAEWEKVKTEARGPWRTIVSKCAEYKSAKEYQLFVSNEGTIHPIKIV